jgi:ubiquinone/menaquinone biosynthesis C-methylase UbiE
MNIQGLLVNTISHKEVKNALRKYACGKMLDIGCGAKPFAAHAKNLVAEHLGLDHNSTGKPGCRADIAASAYDVPCGDQSFDTILCTAVLEHLEEPARALAEANRLLRKGGYAIYSVPLFWHLHEEPRDFYRFTEYGLRYLFEQANFELIEVLPLSGFVVTFTAELSYFLWRLRKGGPLNPFWWIIPLLCAIMQAIAYMLNHFDHSKEFTWVYVVVARKR